MMVSEVEVINSAAIVLVAEALTIPCAPARSVSAKGDTVPIVRGAVALGNEEGIREGE